MGISSDAVAVLTLSWTLLIVLVTFVWRASATATAHSHRISQLEKDGESLSSTIKALTNSITKLDKRLAVNDAVDQIHERASGPPSRSRRNDTEP